MNIMKMSDAKASLVSVLDYNDSLADNHQDADKIVPYIVGQAGLGKTSIVQQACKLVPLRRFIKISHFYSY